MDDNITIVVGWGDEISPILESKKMMYDSGEQVYVSWKMLPKKKQNTSLSALHIKWMFYGLEATVLGNWSIYGSVGKKKKIKNRKTRALLPPE